MSCDKTFYSISSTPYIYQWSPDANSGKWEDNTTGKWEDNTTITTTNPNMVPSGSLNIDIDPNPFVPANPFGTPVQPWPIAQPLVSDPMLDWEAIKRCGPKNIETLLELMREYDYPKEMMEAVKKLKETMPVPIVERNRFDDLILE